jgi:hypothetical protein
MRTVGPRSGGRWSTIPTLVLIAVGVGNQSIIRSAGPRVPTLQAGVRCCHVVPFGFARTALGQRVQTRIVIVDTTTPGTGPGATIGETASIIHSFMVVGRQPRPPRVGATHVWQASITSARRDRPGSRHPFCRDRPTADIPVCKDRDHSGSRLLWGRGKLAGDQRELEA